MTRLEAKYKNEILPRLFERAGTTNPMAVPRLVKIVLSMGVGAALQDKKRLELSSRDLSIIAGQKPVVCKARKSVSNFKVRAGNETGLKVTLRGARMYEFLDRLITIAIPRIRDFRGLNPQSFDGRGNYSMGVSEQSIFPEIDPASIEWTQGLNITIVTTAKNDQDSRELLRLIGMPFQKDTKQGNGRA
ncbi:MAG TPA: 50S ribosomal protein L5 [Phycisphaerae bacterium]|nr:50S ribosomal protein L5 [Phycisphaerae bacterium]HOJ74044.1 50S ribosomal protein L5 [Phycisphaerae bacterium]HOM50639.1 50S ribosomal protein L5 [Phycisphaerae bacterium]HON67408.1 50S ribosomal protein L5 [Phycisphaerae bacterium]HOQ86679.1 50S ribosomal protein L5 [Phycisphaerae bacterium]